ncbi:MAG: CcmD family protein [Bacteroidetes bacterium]|jgi:CcmD family protein|nr:CcmD family protein [Bacteroidota bacterium]
MRKYSWIIMLFSLSALAENSMSLDEFFYQNQKIYVVVAILLIIFLLIVGYLIRLDRKISKLEKNQNEA